MGCLKYYLLTAVFCTVIVFGQSEDIVSPKTTVVLIPRTKLESQDPSTATDDSSASKSTPTISTIPNTEATTITDATTPSTTTPTTTASTKTTPTTTTPTTTTPTTTTPTTTTPTTTTPATTTSTTTTPTTTTEAPITTTTPKPEPQEGTWSYQYKNSNVSCILVQFAAELNVTYTPKDTATLAYKLLNVPKTANVTDGDCGNFTQWLTISWFTTNVTDASLANNLTLVFASNATTKTYELQYLNISLAQDNFPNATSKIVMSHGPEWNVPLATSYRCEPATELKLTKLANSGVAVMKVTHLQEEAFRTTPGKGFSAPRECGSADVPDAVPIAVGCALGGLVLVVLVAYLVARRRSAARGYLSM